MKQKLKYFKWNILNDVILYTNENITPISVYLNLELFYIVAVEEKNPVKNTNSADISSPKRKRKLFSFLKK